jgi:predicted DNA-binding transcriptional regulator YafY
MSSNRKPSRQADNRDKLKRQIEILALVLGAPGEHSVGDMAEFFDVEEITIHRDLRDLRSQGFQLHSSRKKLGLAHSLTRAEQNSFLASYLPMCGTAVGFPKNITFTTKKMGEKALPVFSSLVRGIERQHVLEIHYYKAVDNKTVIRRVRPYHLFATMRDWRMVGWSDGFFKQFLVDNISRVRILEEKFEIDPAYNIEQMFQQAWETYQVDRPKIVKLKFSKDVVPIVRSRVWSEQQVLEDQGDGSVVLTFPVGGLEEIAGWVMGWGQSVSVLSPPKLREMLLEMARGIISQNT